MRVSILLRNIFNKRVFDTIKELSESLKGRIIGHYKKEFSESLKPVVVFITFNDYRVSLVAWCY